MTDGEDEGEVLPLPLQDLRLPMLPGIGGHLKIVAVIMGLGITLPLQVETVITQAMQVHRARL